MAQRFLLLTIILSLPVFLRAGDPKENPGENPENTLPCAPKKPRACVRPMEAAARKVVQPKTWGFVKGELPTLEHTFKNPVVISFEPVSRTQGITIEVLLRNPDVCTPFCLPWAQEVAKKALTVEQITFVRSIKGEDEAVEDTVQDTVQGTVEGAPQAAAATGTAPENTAPVPQVAPQPAPWEVYPDLLMHFPKLKSLVFACEIASLPYVDRPENLVKLCLQDIPATGGTILTPDVLAPLNDFTHLRALALCFREGDITNFQTHLKTQPIGAANVEDRFKAITSQMQSIEAFLPTLAHKQLEALKLHVLSGAYVSSELQGLIAQNPNLKACNLGFTQLWSPPNIFHQLVLRNLPVARMQLTFCKLHGISYFNTENLETLTLDHCDLEIFLQENALHQAPKLREVCFYQTGSTFYVGGVSPIPQDKLWVNGEKRALPAMDTGDLNS